MKLMWDLKTLKHLPIHWLCMKYRIRIVDVAYISSAIFGSMYFFFPISSYGLYMEVPKYCKAIVEVIWSSL